MKMENSDIGKWFWRYATNRKLYRNPIRRRILGDMKCPKCGSRMTVGGSHDDRYTLQYECRNCGKVIPKEK